MSWLHLVSAEFHHPVRQMPCEWDYPELTAIIEACLIGYPKNQRFCQSLPIFLLSEPYQNKGICHVQL
jgi:hypothetical protein